MTEAQGELLLESLGRVEFMLHVAMFAVCFMGGAATVRLILYAMTRRNMLGLLLAVTVLWASPALAQFKSFNTVIEVTVSGASGAKSHLNGTYELWDQAHHNIQTVWGTTHFDYTDWNGDGKLLHIRCSLIASGPHVQVEISDGGTAGANYQQYRVTDEALPTTLSYVGTLQSGFPATITVSATRPKTSGSVSVDFGSPPSEDVDPEAIMEVDSLIDEWTTAPVYGGYFEAPDMNDPEHGFPEFENNLFEPLIVFPTVTSTTNHWFMPIGSALASSGLASLGTINLPITTSPVLTFGASTYGGLHNLVNQMRLLFRVILSAICFWWFVRAIQRTLVFA